MSVSELAGDTVPQNKQQLSFGQKLVGINFNPSVDDRGSIVKGLFAQIVDIVDDNSNPNEEKTRLSILLRDHTLGEILNAQMNVVKLLTLKY